MRMVHLLLEMYCENNEDCIYSKDKIGIHCLANNCNLLSYTYCPNELSYSGDEGVIWDRDSFIGFGSEMDVALDSKNYEKEHLECLQKWEQICKEKIDDAYVNYMSHKK